MIDIEPVLSLYQATESMIPTLPSLVKGHKFRAFSLAALDYTAKRYGFEFTSENHQATAGIIDLGIEINDHFDINHFNREKYRRIRKLIHEDAFASEQYSNYFRTVREIERGRPHPGDTSGCIRYREQLNLVSLAVSCSFAFRLPLGAMINTRPQVSLKDSSPTWFEPLFLTVMALQVVDDMVGFRGDLANDRPSFFTAFGGLQSGSLPEKDLVNQRFAQMGRLFDGYIEKAKNIDSGYIYPFAMASKLIYHSLPKMAEFLRHPGLEPFASALLTHRDVERK